MVTKEPVKIVLLESDCPMAKACPAGPLSGISQIRYNFHLAEPSGAGVQNSTGPSSSFLATWPHNRHDVTWAAPLATWRAPGATTC